MPNQTPLNPDALESAFDAVEHPAVTRDDMEDIVSDAVRAYLTVAQPEARCVERHSPDLVCDGCEPPTLAQPVVNSVEELDALRAGSVVRDRAGRVWTAFEPRVSMPGVEYYRWMCPDGGFIRRKGWFSGFPATVLYRPEDSDA